MPVLRIGSTEITYEVRYSDRARKKRITVTPEGVEVVAPRGAPGEDVTAFVNEKRRWLFDAVREIAALQGKLLNQYYASGAKVQYRGRWLMLKVESGDNAVVQVGCRSKFHVTVPRMFQGEQKFATVKRGLERWLRVRANRDMLAFCRKHSKSLGVSPKGTRIMEAKHKWGSCGRDGVIRIHWRLIQAPKVAMEYVVAHEMVHLIHRNHGPEFWKKLTETMPNWPIAKQMLEEWEVDHRAV